MSKRVRSLLVAVCAALALLVAAPAANATPIFGFNDPWLPANAAQTIALTQQFGANSERIMIYWGSVEPARGAYDWHGLDDAYNMMLAAGIRPLLDVVSAPQWATASGCNSIFKCQQAPRHDPQFAEFLRALVGRYRQAVGVEIGNEPNMAYWTVHPDPGRYAQILKVGYAAVKQIDPQMPVITGATCCTTAHGDSMPAPKFLSRLYAAGAKGHFDYIGFHLYPGGPVSRVAPDLRLEMDRMRAVRDANGDSNRKFWITETGFPSAGVSPYGGGVLTEENQAEREAIDYRVVQTMPDIAALYIYRLTDPASGTLGASMGIYRADLTPKPAVPALLDALHAPPWPTYSVSATAPKRIRAGHYFQIRVVGGALPPNAQFDWVIWRAPYWSHFPGGKPQPVTRLRIWHPGTYLLAAQVSTSLDSFLSAPIKVQVVLKAGGHGASHRHKHHRRHHRKHH